MLKTPQKKKRGAVKAADLVGLKPDDLTRILLVLSKDLHRQFKIASAGRPERQGEILRALIKRFCEEHSPR